MFYTLSTSAVILGRYTFCHHILLLFEREKQKGGEGGTETERARDKEMAIQICHACVSEKWEEQLLTKRISKHTHQHNMVCNKVSEAICMN